jgi:predicted dehydrogenase
MTESLNSDRKLAARLNRDSPQAVMLAFQRRFDGPLQYAKKLLDEGAIGRPFKIVSILEDSNPLPDGYVSPGLLKDMSIHNVDEVLWLSGLSPVAAACIGSRIYSHRLTTADEDFDDGFLYLWFDGEVCGQIQVSRNHVSGYRVETWIFGEKGNIHIGHFEQKRLEVVVEAYGREKAIAREVFQLKPYGPSVPEFVDRFGAAYKEEIAYFVRRCRKNEPFSVNHEDGLRAMEVIEAASRAPITRQMAAALGGA